MNNSINFQDRKDIYLGMKHQVKKRTVKKNNELDIINDEPLKQPKMIPRQIGIKIQQKRQELKLTQKDLAFKINVKVDIIQKIETGNYVYDCKLLNKLERILNIKL